MKLPRFLPLFLAAITALAGCQKAVESAVPVVDLSEPRAAQPKLPTIGLWLGAEHLNAEMALTSEQERTGMMFRTQMADNEAMIFVFPPQRASFWMKNCPLPLSVAYIDMDGVIQEIHDLVPHNTNAVNSVSSNIGYALETTRGWFDRHQVRAGMTVRTERGSLMETFRQGR